MKAHSYNKPDKVEISVKPMGLCERAESRPNVVLLRPDVEVMSFNGGKL